MERARAYLRIRGLVQGVFFRASMREVARRLGVAGWVRNMPDGSVEAVVEGPREAVEKVIQWARRGPPAAIVESVEVVWEEPRGDLHGFTIRYDTEPYTPRGSRRETLPGLR